MTEPEQARTRHHGDHAEQHARRPAATPQPGSSSNDLLMGVSSRVAVPRADRTRSVADSHSGRCAVTGQSPLAPSGQRGQLLKPSPKSVAGQPDLGHGGGRQRGQPRQQQLWPQPELGRRILEAVGSPGRGLRQTGSEVCRRYLPLRLVSVLIRGLVDAPKSAGCEPQVPVQPGRGAWGDPPALVSASVSVTMTSPGGQAAVGDPPERRRCPASHAATDLADHGCVGGVARPAPHPAPGPRHG